MQQVFQASEIADLIGIPQARLAKFVESPGYGVSPSQRKEAGKGIPRLYTLDDLLTIALAWWLFQAGLRSKVIGEVVPKATRLVGNSQTWSKGSDRFLVVRRGIAAGANFVQRVCLEDPTDILAHIGSDRYHATQVLPVGALLERMWSKMNK